MAVQKKASTYSAQRPEATVCAASPGNPSWDSRHVKCCLFAQQRRRKYARSLPHILRPRSGPPWQRVANFFRHLEHSTGKCVVYSDPIHATHVVVKVPGTYRIERLQRQMLSGHRDAETLSLILYAKISSMRKPGSAGEVGQSQPLTEVMCTFHTDSRAQPASGIAWQQNKRDRCAVMLCKACSSKRFQNRTAHLWQTWKKLDKFRPNLGQI